MRQTDIHMTGAEPDELWPLVKQFHYSKRMPSNIQHCYAVRNAGGLFGDNGDPLAGIIYAIPGAKWGEEVIELSRLVRRPEFPVPLTQLIAFSTGWLKRQGWALVVSFADRTHGHHGGIYQAAGWNYDGQRDRAMDGIIFDGVFKPGRTCNHVWGTRSPDKLRFRFPDASIEPHYDEGKHLYWKPLAIAGRTKAKRLGLKSIPYPKPNAIRPADEPVPTGASEVQPLGIAPNLEGVA